jgi:hypothetical protein
MPRGPKGEKRPADVIGNAVKVMRILTGEETETIPADDGKDLAAKALGKKEVTGLRVTVTVTLHLTIDPTRSSWRSPSRGEISEARSRRNAALPGRGNSPSRDRRRIAAAPPVRSCG